MKHKLLLLNNGDAMVFARRPKTYVYKRAVECLRDTSMPKK